MSYEAYCHESVLTVLKMTLVQFCSTEMSRLHFESQCREPEEVCTDDRGIFREIKQFPVYLIIGTLKPVLLQVDHGCAQQ